MCLGPDSILAHLEGEYQSLGDCHGADRHRAKVFSCVIRRQFNQQSQALLNTSATTRAYLVKTRSNNRVHHILGDTLGDAQLTPSAANASDAPEPQVSEEGTWESTEYADDIVHWFRPHETARGPCTSAKPR